MTLFIGVFVSVLFSITAGILLTPSILVVVYKE